jgi:hypothetical protein
MVRTLCVEPPRDALAVERVHPLEALGHRARLVALQLADEVPGERQSLQGLDLRLALADVVLAEFALAGRRGRRDRRQRLLLAHRQQPHRRRIAPGLPGRGFDARQHGRELRGRELRSG